MRILYITQNLIPKSGWGTFSYHTVTNMAKRGHEVVVLANEPNPDVNMEQHCWLPGPAEVVYNPIDCFKAMRAIKKAITTFKPDCIHFLVEPYMIGLTGFPKKKLPHTVMNLHGTYCASPFATPFFGWLYNKAAQKVDHFLPCSDFTFNKASTASNNVTRKHMADNHTFFRFGIEHDVTNCEAADGKKHILFVGGIKPRKGVAELLRGFAEFAKNHPGTAHLDFIGMYQADKPYAQEFQKIIDENQLTNDVTFHGFVDQDMRAQLFGQGAVLALLSRSVGNDFEGYGLSLIEANALGIPTIASHDNGCAEAIDEGKSGYRVHADSPADIAEKLENILINEAINPTDCIAWAQSHNIPQMLDTFEIVYAAN